MMKVTERVTTFFFYICLPYLKVCCLKVLMVWCRTAKLLGAAPFVNEPTLPTDCFRFFHAPPPQRTTRSARGERCFSSRLPLKSPQRSSCWTLVCGRWSSSDLHFISPSTFPFTYLCVRACVRVHVCAWINFVSPSPSLSSFCCLCFTCLFLSIR